MAENPELRGALDGIRIVDFTQTLAGPHCTWLLSCLGADVIKVEGPTGDYLRPAKHGTVFASANRNKRSIVIDLKTDAGKKMAHRLVAKSDVLVENYRTGTMERLGLSYQVAKKLNPQLVYASISGYGQEGPYASRPGYDPIGQALAGIMSATGSSESGPLRVGTSIIDYSAGMYAALAIVAAIHRKHRYGVGAYLDISLLESAMSFMSQHYTHFSATGERPIRRGTANDTFVPFQVFDVADGSVFVGVGTDRMFQDFCRIFGLDELAADEGLQTIQARHDRIDEVVPIVAEVLKKYSREYVIQALLDAGIPVADVMSVDETMNDPHVLDRGAVCEIDDAELGRIVVTPFPVIIDRQERTGGVSAPTLGQHTDEIIRELDL